MVSATPKAALGLVVAMASDGGIGLGGRLPWRIPEDLRRFKALTMGHAIIMGRKTHESIGRALVGRRNIVVTRHDVAFPGCEVVHSLEEALVLARENDEMPLVIGGAQLYAQALPSATHLFVTQIDHPVEADVFFPPVDWSQWREVRVEMGPPGVRYVDFERLDV